MNRAVSPITVRYCIINYEEKKNQLNLILTEVHDEQYGLLVCIFITIGILALIAMITGLTIAFGGECLSIKYSRTNYVFCFDRFTCSWRK